jgi:hypothetical protein
VEILACLLQLGCLTWACLLGLAHASDLLSTPRCLPKAVAALPWHLLPWRWPRPPLQQALGRCWAEQVR